MSALTRYARLILLFTTAALMVSVLPVRDGFTAMDRATRIRAMKGIVLILALKKQGGKFTVMGRGSGSIISPDGLILTNNHVVADQKTNVPHDAVGVCLTTSFDKTPRPTCLAWPSRAVRSQKLDLALIKCEAEVNGRPLRRAISWPVVQLGDSSTIVPGDELNIVGYPGIGGSTITFTAGKTSGFLDDQKVGARAWIKTDALISPGVSGGAAFDDAGKLVGVPTQLRWRQGGRTNIGLVRPINRGKALIASVRGRDWKSIPRSTAPSAAAPSAGGGGKLQLGPVSVDGGLSEARVTQVLQGRLTAFGTCTSKTSRGYMDIHVTIGPTGRVTRAKLERTTVNDRAMAICVGKAVYATTFPTAAAATRGNFLLIFLGGGGAPTPPPARPTPPAPAPPAPTPPAPKVIPKPPPRKTPRYRSGTSYVAGQLRDASTGQPVIGAVVLILKPGVSVGSLNRDNLSANTATVGVSTSLGYFRTRTSLAQGKSYGLVILAKGYKAVAVDDAVKLMRGTPPVLSLGVLNLRRQGY